MWSKPCIDFFVVVAAATLVLGVIMAIHMSEPAWLFLCFALARFL